MREGLENQGVIYRALPEPGHRNPPQKKKANGNAPDKSSTAVPYGVDEEKVRQAYIDKIWQAVRDACSGR